MTVFAGAAQFLQGILLGPNSVESRVSDPSIDPDVLLRNAYETGDLEATRRENDMSSEKRKASMTPHTGHRRLASKLNQPKPKFVAHKAATKGKSRRMAKRGGRLGGGGMA